MKYHYVAIINYFMMKLFLFLMAIFITFVGVGADMVLAQEGNFNITGYLKNASSFIVSRDNANDLLKCENIFQLEPVYNPTENMKIYGIFRAYYDAIFDLEKSGWTDNFNYKSEIRKNNPNTISDPVRELYMEIRLEDFFVRLGKQQVAWGEAIGMKMLDVINPMDLRELNQTDFEDSRIPLWMLNIKYNPPVRGSNIQLLLIPDIEPHYISPAGYPFSPQNVNLFQSFVNANALHLAESATLGEKVPQDLSNMEIGIKWYQNFAGFEYSLNYFYHWSDVPGFYPSTPHLGFPAPVNYDLKYHRYHTIGGKFTNLFGNFFGLDDVIMRFELAAHLEDRIPCRYASIGEDTANYFGITMDQTDTINYLWGLDKFFFTDHFLSLQFYQFYTLNWQDGYLSTPNIYGVKGNELLAGDVDWVENMLTFFASTDYLNERIFPDLLFVYDDDGALWFRGRCKFKCSDNLFFNAGTNLYFGNEDTLFGQYGDKDNVFIEVKQTF